MNVATRFVLAGLLMSSVAAFGCGASDNEPADSDDDTVDTSESAVVGAVGMTVKAFTPAKLVVKKGTTVTFTNTSPISHTVTSGASSKVSDKPGALFDAVVPPKGKFTFTFTTVGVQPYFCRPHEKAGMKGSITVTN